MKEQILTSQYVARLRDFAGLLARLFTHLGGGSGVGCEKCLAPHVTHRQGNVVLVVLDSNLGITLIPSLRIYRRCHACNMYTRVIPNMSFEKNT